MSPGVRKPDLNAACVRTPARCDIRGIDAIKGDGCRAGTAYAIRAVGGDEGVHTTQDHGMLDPAAVDVIADDCTCVVDSVRVRLLRCRDGLDISEQECQSHRDTYAYTEDEQEHSNDGPATLHLASPCSPFSVVSKKSYGMKQRENLVSISATMRVGSLAYLCASVSSRSGRLSICRFAGRPRHVLATRWQVSVQ